MSSSKNDLYYLGNGWGWFVSIDYIDTPRLNHYTPHIPKREKLETIKSIKSINSMKSTSNLLDLHERHNKNNKDTEQKYSSWGLDAVCLLSLIAFGFIII